MDLGSIFLILALLVCVGVFISRPFFEQAPVPGHTNRHAQDESSLLAERERILNALQELDFDHMRGKIPDEDYPLQRAALIEQGVLVLKTLDDLQVVDAGQAAEARLEAVIAARRIDALPQVPVEVSVSTTGRLLEDNADDPLEAMLANRRRIRKEKAGGFCPQCGGPVQKSDIFCSRCGAKLA